MYLAQAILITSNVLHTNPPSSWQLPASYNIVGTKQTKQTPHWCYNENSGKTHKWLSLKNPAILHPRCQVLSQTFTTDWLPHLLFDENTIQIFHWSQERFRHVDLGCVDSTPHWGRCNGYISGNMRRNQLTEREDEIKQTHTSFQENNHGLWDCGNGRHLWENKTVFDLAHNSYTQYASHTIHLVLFVIRSWLPRQWKYAHTYTHISTHTTPTH